MAEIFFGFCRYSCGCMQTIEVPESRKGEMIEVDVPCSECRKRMQGQETETEIRIQQKRKLDEKAREESIGNRTKKSDVKVPKLTGPSGKSINWATQLRQEFIEQWTLNGQLNERAADAVAMETESQFWISNKNQLKNWDFLQNTVFVDESAINKNYKLTGSDSQIKWARTIRVGFLRSGLSDIYPDVLKNETTAKWWIDNRDNLNAQWLDTEYEPTQQETEEVGTIKLEGTAAQIKSAKMVIKELIMWSKQYLDSDMQAKALNLIETQSSSSWWLRNRNKLYNQDFIAKATIYKDEDNQSKLDATLETERFLKRRDAEVAIHPSRDIANGIFVRITCQQDSMIIVSEATGEKDFQLFLKENFIYNDGKNWRRDLDSLTGNFIDRSAELGLKLLAKGYTVCIYSERAREQVLAKKFIPEHTKWVVNDANSESMIFIERGATNLGDKILLSFTGARADPQMKGVVVPYRVDTIAAVMQHILFEDYKLEDIAKIKIIKYLKLAAERE